MEAGIVRGADGWKLAARRAGTHSLAVWPPLVLAFLVVVSVRAHAFAFDFAHGYLSGAHGVLHGRSPYPPASGLLASVSQGASYEYPPLMAWLATPFTALPLPAAEAAAFMLAIAAVVATLLVLDVRDWRCYMAAFLWVPTYSAVQTANVTALLALAIALLWRLRRSALAAGLLLGLLVALKLYLWPLALLFLGARRYRTVAVGAAAAVALLVVTWAPIGFAGLRGYPHLLQVVTRVDGPHRYTLAALLYPLLPWPVAVAVASAAGLAAAWLTLCLARRGDEQRALACAIGAAFLLSPIVSMNYFLLLAVVIAVFAPTFGPLWLLPLALWVGPQATSGRPWQNAAVLAIVAATLIAATRRPVQAQLSNTGASVAYEQVSGTGSYDASGA